MQCVSSGVSSECPVGLWRSLVFASISIETSRKHPWISYAGHTDRDPQMPITCIIRYEIDPFQRDAFREYAERWGKIIPRCGGHLVGYFLPHEGTNNIAWGLISFPTLSDPCRLRNVSQLPQSGSARSSKLCFCSREEIHFARRAIVR